MEPRKNSAREGGSRGGKGCNGVEVLELDVVVVCLSGGMSAQGLEVRQLRIAVVCGGELSDNEQQTTQDHCHYCHTST